MANVYTHTRTCTRCITVGGPTRERASFPAARDLRDTGLVCVFEPAHKNPRSDNCGHHGNRAMTSDDYKQRRRRRQQRPPYRVARCEREDNEGHSTNTVRPATPALYPFTESSLPPPPREPMVYTPPRPANHPTGTKYASLPHFIDFHRARAPFYTYNARRRAHESNAATERRWSDVKKKHVEILRDREKREKQFSHNS